MDTQTAQSRRKIHMSPQPIVLDARAARWAIGLAVAG